MLGYLRDPPTAPVSPSVVPVRAGQKGQGGGGGIDVRDPPGVQAHLPPSRWGPPTGAGPCCAEFLPPAVPHRLQRVEFVKHIRRAKLEEEETARAERRAAADAARRPTKGVIDLAPQKTGEKSKRTGSPSPKSKKYAKDNKGQARADCVRAAVGSGQACPGLSLGNKKEGRVRDANRNGRPRGRSLLHSQDMGKTQDHRSDIEQWLAAGGGWR